MSSRSSGSSSAIRIVSGVDVIFWGEMANINSNSESGE